MARLVIQGGRTIAGVHAVSGNKNAVLPMIAASPGMRVRSASTAYSPGRSVFSVRMANSLSSISANRPVWVSGASEAHSSITAETMYSPRRREM